MLAKNLNLNLNLADTIFGNTTVILAIKSRDVKILISEKQNGFVNVRLILNQV